MNNPNVIYIGKTIWSEEKISDDSPAYFSEEQMGYLKKVYESYYACDGERGALESLYNDLKKL